MSEPTTAAELADRLTDAMDDAYRGTPYVRYDRVGRFVLDNRAAILAAMRAEGAAEVARLREALLRIEAWSYHYKSEARTQLRGTMKLVYEAARAALAATPEPGPAPLDVERLDEDRLAAAMRYGVAWTGVPLPHEWRSIAGRVATEYARLATDAPGEPQSEPCPYCNGAGCLPCRGRGTVGRAFRANRGLPPFTAEASIRADERMQAAEYRARLATDAPGGAK